MAAEVTDLHNLSRRLTRYQKEIIRAAARGGARLTVPNWRANCKTLQRFGLATFDDDLEELRATALGEDLLAYLKATGEYSNA